MSGVRTGNAATECGHHPLAGKIKCTVIGMSTRLADVSLCGVCLTGRVALYIDADEVSATTLERRRTVRRGPE